jgi:hypothetical protein
MPHYENVWSFATRNFRVTFDACPDDDLDLSWDDDGSIAEGLESGKYVAFIARVQVICTLTDAVMGEDTLGNCIYGSPAEFINHRGGKGGAYFPDMVRTACKAARREANLMPRLRAVS